MSTHHLIAAARRAVFQGEPGSFSHLATREALPHCEAFGAPTFSAAFAALAKGEVDIGVLPVENTIYGPITDVHRLLAESSLQTLGEHALRVRLQVLGVRGATLAGIKTLVSQDPALGQCRKLIAERNFKTVSWPDTAAAARHVAETGDPSLAAIASALAGEIHGLSVLQANVEDNDANMTRFLLLSCALPPNPE